jgi:predicted metal-dependent HD superfamily phosphohydrolase
MSFSAEHRRRFVSLLVRLGVHNPVESIWCAIDRAYSEPHRAYHTSEHIVSLLEIFDSDWFQQGYFVPSPLAQTVRDELEAAIWWHDAVYQTTIHSPGLSNEEASAAWAFTFLMTNGGKTDTACVVHKLILATSHEHCPNSTRTMWIADLDLAILGADEERFKLYDTQVAAEYAHVFYPDYLQGRIAFLTSFVQSRNHIYQTMTFRERYEDVAQSNIKKLIVELEAELKELRHD